MILLTEVPTRMPQSKTLMKNVPFHFFVKKNTIFCDFSDILLTNRANDAKNYR